MKLSIWDVLTALVIVAILVAIGFFALVFAFPSLGFNPFPPRYTEVPPLVIPTSTSTPIALPPVWTATPLSITEAPAQGLRPSSTPVPTNTPFILPSFTVPAKTTYPTKERPTLLGKCKVLNQTPADGTTFKPEEIFTTAWTLQNTDDENWGSDSIDVRWTGGDNIHTSGQNVIDLPETVVPGGRYDITIQMKAPSGEGYHITYWALMAGTTPRCTFYVEIFVED